jgi:adenylate cyclase
MSMRLKVFTGIFLIAFLASGATGSFFYQQAREGLYQSIREQLQASASNIAALINGDALDSVRTAEDKNSKSYKDIQKLLRAVTQSTSEYLYAYTMRLKGGQVEFVVDTPPSDDDGDGKISEDEMPAPIGTVYKNPPQSLLQGFVQTSSDKEPYVDQWGRTMSGYAPIFDSRGESVGLLGIDMDVSRIHQKLSAIVNGGMISLGLASTLAIILGIYFSRQTLVPIRQLQAAMSRVQEGDYAHSLKTTRRDEFGQLADNFNNMVAELRQKAWLEKSMGKVVNKNVLKRMLNNELQLGGEVVQATVLSCDLRGFTALSEKLPPKLLVSLLNEYFTVMIKVVEKHGGIVDKLIGDSIMAVFGYPQSLEKQEEAAFNAALELLSACDQLNTTMGLEEEMHLVNSVGLHTGTLMAGNIGSPERMEFTVMGDAVNVACRLENLTRQLETRLAASGPLVEKLEDNPLQSAGSQHLSGRHQEIEVFILDAQPQK